MDAAIVSIHDVMPSTMDQTAELIELCANRGVNQTTLLVVPGLEWSPPMLDQLRDWQNSGHEIAAHGWIHQCGKISSWYHRGHSLVLSRRAAEHLSLAETSIFELMTRAAQWFDDNFSAIPQLYVPPAWAMGSISLDRIWKTPFRMIETLTSILDVKQRQTLRLPLLGFEADTIIRQCLLQTSNKLNLALAKRIGSTIRIAIHPYDHQLRLAKQLKGCLRQVNKTMHYSEACL